MNRDLTVSFLASFLLHFSALLALSMLVTQSPSKEAFFTEITVIGVSPYGSGLGKKNVVVQKESVVSRPTKPDTAITSDNPVKQSDEGTILPKAEPRTDEYINKLRETVPIGVAVSSVAPTSPVREDDFGFGDDSKQPGVPWGNPNVTGSLAQRAIKLRHIPEYPDWAKKKGIEGKVKLGIIVTPSGSVKEEVEVLQKSGYKELDDLAALSIKKWIFEPLPVYIKQENQYGVISFRFDLSEQR